MKRALVFALLAAGLTAAPAARAEGPNWQISQFDGMRTEFGVGGTSGAYATRTGAVVGATAHVGRRMYQRNDPHMFWGDYFGYDLRLHGWRSLASDGHDASTFAVGVGAVLSNVLGEGWSRWRVPSFIGAIVPEVGWSAGTSSKSSVYTSHSLPFVFLMDKGLAFQAAPAVWLFYRTERGTADVMVTLSLSLLFRAH